MEEKKEKKDEKVKQLTLEERVSVLESSFNKRGYFIILLSFFVAGILILTYHKYTVSPFFEKVGSVISQGMNVGCVDIDKLLQNTMVKYAKETDYKFNAEDVKSVTNVIKDSINKFDGYRVILVSNMVLKGCEDLTKEVERDVNMFLKKKNK